MTSKFILNIFGKVSPMFNFVICSNLESERIENMSIWLKQSITEFTAILTFYSELH